MTWATARGWSPKAAMLARLPEGWSWGKVSNENVTRKSYGVKVV